MAGCTTEPVDPVEPPTEAVEEDRSIAPGVYPIDGSDPSLPRDDLNVLASLADATIIGLGESIHTSAGMYRAKSRLIQALVEDHGFRVIAMETPWWRAKAVGDWVDAGVAGSPGPVRAQMDSLFPVWWDTEVRDLLRWTCDYNEAHPDDPVAFMGWDIQQGPEDIALLREHFGTTADVDGLLADCAGFGFASTDAFRSSNSWGSYQSGSVPAETHTSCTAGIDALEAQLLDAGASEAADRARLSTVGLRAFEGQTYLWPNAPASFTARDAGNGVVLPEILRLDHPNARALIWAHNAHIQKNLSATCGYYCEAVGLGELLDDHYGDTYKVIGILAWDIEIDWPGVTAPASPIDEPGTLERALHRLEHPFLWVDPTVPESEFGGSFMVGTSRLEMEVAQQFDRLMFVDESEAMTWILP